MTIKYKTTRLLGSRPVILGKLDRGPKNKKKKLYWSSKNLVEA